MATVDAVEIVFKSGGIAEVLAAFRSVEQAMILLEKTQKASGERVAKETVRQHKGAADTVAKEAAKAEKARTAAAEAEAKRRNAIVMNSAKMAGQLAGQQVKEAAAAERAKTAAAEAEAKKRAGDAAKAAKTAAALFSKEAKDADAAEKAKTKSAEREARLREAIQMNSARAAGRLAEQQTRQEEREAQKRTAFIAAEARKQSAAVAKTRAGLARVGGSAARAAGGAVSGAANMAMRLAGGAFALGGGFSVADAMQKQMAGEDAAVALSNAAYIPGDPTAGKRVDPTQLLNEAKGVQASTNIDKGELLAGLQSYVEKSSDLQGGRDNLGWMAKLAKGSGSKFGDIMNAAGMLKVQNPNLAPDEMKQMMLDIAGQGKLGAVSITDLASITGKITSTAGTYQGNQKDNQRKLLGLSQIAMRTAGSADDAGTAVARLSSDLSSHRDKIAGDFGKDFAGKLVNDKGQVADPADALAAIFEKTGGDTGKMGEGAGHIGLGKESMKIMDALLPTYNAAETAQKGSGGSAVAAEVRKSTAATYGGNDVQEDFARVMATSSQKLSTALNELQELIAAKVTPHVRDFADKLPALMPHIDKLIDKLDEWATMIETHPWTAVMLGLGALITKAILGEIMTAAIGKGVGVAMNALIAALMPAAAVPTAVATGVEAAALGTAGTAATAATTATAATGAGGTVVGAGTLGGAGTALAAGGVVATLLAAGAVHQAGARQEAIDAGTMDAQGVAGVDTSTDAGRARARSLEAKIRRDMDNAKEQRGKTTMGDWAQSLVDPEGAKKSASANNAALDATLKTLGEGFDELQRKLKGVASAIPDGAVAANSPARNTNQGAPARGGATD